MTDPLFRWPTPEEAADNMFLSEMRGRDRVPLHRRALPQRCKNCGQVAELHGTCNTCPVFVRIGEVFNPGGGDTTWWDPSDGSVVPPVA